MTNQSPNNDFGNSDQVLAEVMNIMMDAKESLGPEQISAVYNKVRQLLKELSGYE